MGRTEWLGAMTLLAGVYGAGWALRWPEPGPALACRAADVVLVGQGDAAVARCRPLDVQPGVGLATAPLPSRWARAVGQRLDLNRATDAELATIPGLGAHLAKVLVKAREARRGFGNWEEVDAVPGVGPAKLRTLQNTTDLRP